MTNTLPKDSNNIVYEGQRDIVGGKFVARQAGTVTTENGVDSAPERVEVSNFPSTQPVSGTVAVSNLPGTQPISGSVSVSNFPATQPVSAAALPLPTGAATEAGHLATIDTSAAAVSTATGAQADSAWSGSGNGGVIGILKAIYAKVAGTLAINAASLPLPSGASTAAKQPALGTAGSASADVLSIQGVASMTAVKTDGSATTQPVSAASLPLPSNAAKETGGNLATLVTNTTSLAPTAGYAATTSPPSATNAGADTSYTFAAQVRHWLLQNNTSANVQFELDTAASAGSIVLAPGATWLSDIPVTVLHLYTVAVQNINGSSAGNIIVKGWL